MYLFFYVGVPGFEPGTPCSQSRCANRTALHPEGFYLKSGGKGRAFLVMHQMWSAFFLNFSARVGVISKINTIFAV